MPEKILVAVAWPYASGSRHLGHVAGFGVPSDVFARYQRLKGNDVLMVSGTDDHGTPTTLRALKEGKTPQQIVDYYNREIGDNLTTLGCSYDLFTRTTTANHYAVTQDLVTRLWQNGYLFKQTAAAMYCETDRRFLPDRYVEGTCPYCGYAGARGDLHDLPVPAAQADPDPAPHRTRDAAHDPGELHPPPGRDAEERRGRRDPRGAALRGAGHRDLRGLRRAVFRRGSQRASLGRAQARGR